MSEGFNDLKSKFDKRFEKEIEEIKKNKIRIAGLAFCVIAFGLFSLSENLSGGEEISLNSPPEQIQPDETKQKPDNKPEVTPAKKNSPENLGENVTPVIGANSSALYVKDPFARPKKIKQPEKNKIPAPNVPPPPVQNPATGPEEKFVLNGIAISEKKIALVSHLFKRDGKNFREDLMLTVGENLGRRKILNITPNGIIFDTGEKLILNGEFF